MDIIPKQNPVEINETFDVWHVLALVIQTPPNQPYRLRAEFGLVRETGETLTETVTDEHGETTEQPVLWIDGTARNEHREHPDKPRVTLDIPDLLAYIREQIADGDTEWATLFAAVQAKLVQTAVAKGLIDVGQTEG